MPISIQSFQILGLHGKINVSVNITGDRVVLVGVNGLGKTTIINILFFFLTRQWSKLAEYSFERVSLRIGEEDVSVSSDDLAELRARRSFLGRMGGRITRSPRLQELAEQAFRTESRTAVHELAARLGTTPSVIMNMLEDTPQQLLFETESHAVMRAEKRLTSLVPAQTLYLPTYRRIERDLKTILPELEEDITRYRRRRKRARDESEHIEFVEFGMEDVELLLERALGELRESARTAVNRLASNYLQDVIHDRADRFDHSVLERLLAANIDRVLGRVDDKTMTEMTKRQLKKSLEGMTQHPDQDPPAPNQKYVAHFVAKLLDVHETLSEREGQVTRFVEVTNSYLTGKRLVFDDLSYTVTIRLDEEAEIGLASLSSGEKQIVSLFAHVFLGGQTPLVVLIDEPELSLSVDWQKKLLPDILRSDRCEFLAAVTHSPFIFANELDESTLDLATCLSRYEPPRID